MTTKKFPFQEIQLSCALSLVLVSFTSYPPRVPAQSAESVPKTLEQARIRFGPPKLPPDAIVYGRRRGGASRDDCPELDKPITALLPGIEEREVRDAVSSVDSKQRVVGHRNFVTETVDKVKGGTSAKTISKSFLGLTVSERPTFWVYVPKMPTTTHPAEFVLQDEDEDIYRTPLVLPEKPGVMSISLPSSPQYSLQINKKYRWYFKVYCDQPQKKSKYFFVDGWVQRVALTPDIESQLKATKARDYIVYAKNNLWYDAVTHLANLRRTNSQNTVLNQEWAYLLKSVSLQDLAQEPIVQTHNAQRP